MLAKTVVSAFNYETPFLNPGSDIYTLYNGNSFPWLGNSSTGRGVNSKQELLAVKNSFGSKKINKKPAGYAFRNGSLVKVYKISGFKGKLFGDGKKVKSRVFNSKATANRLVSRAKVYEEKRNIRSKQI
jgi:hypothetical protein